MSALPVTMLYAGALAVVFLVLSIRVIQQRHSAGVSLGDGGDAALNRRIRAHGNFAEYVPLCLLLLAALEAGGTAAWGLHLLGILLLAARIGHGYALAFSEQFVAGRMFGTLGTFVFLLVAGLACLLQGLGALA